MIAAGSLSAVQVKLFKPGSAFDTTEPLQDWTNASVGASGEIYYTIPAALCDELGENYRAFWRYTASSTVYYADSVWHVVNTILDLQITAEDMDREEPTLSQYGQITAAIKNNYIEGAYRRVWSELVGRGRMPWMIFNSFDINRVILYRALAQLCLSQNTGQDSPWFAKFLQYNEFAENALKYTPITYMDGADCPPTDGEVYFHPRIIGGPIPTGGGY